MPLLRCQSRVSRPSVAQGRFSPLSVAQCRIAGLRGLTVAELGTSHDRPCSLVLKRYQLAPVGFASSRAFGREQVASAVSVSGRTDTWSCLGFDYQPV